MKKLGYAVKYKNGKYFGDGEKTTSIAKAEVYNKKIALKILSEDPDLEKMTPVYMVDGDDLKGMEYYNSY
jgi:hypothetical protein